MELFWYSADELIRFWNSSKQDKVHRNGKCLKEFLLRSFLLVFKYILKAFFWQLDVLATRVIGLVCGDIHDLYDLLEITQAFNIYTLAALTPKALFFCCLYLQL